MRGFLRAYASYLGLDGRLFVDEYASRFGTRHDDELFRRRRERPMTQRRESSSAVLVALIAVVAIGVLFFVAWRFGPGRGDAAVADRHVDPDRDDEASPNVNPAIAADDHADDHASRRRAGTAVARGRAPARRRHAGHETTWVKITRLSTGKVIAQKDVAPGGHLGGGALQDAYGFAIESGIPGNVSLAVNGHTFALNGTGPWLVTADTDGPHVVPGKIPPPPAHRAAVTAGRPTAALLVTGQELLLGLVADANTRFLAHELDALGIELRRVSIVGDGHDEIAAGLRELAGHDLVITSGGLGPTHDDRTVEAVAEVAGAELVARRAAARDDRRHHRRRSRAGGAPTRRSTATATASRRSCRAARP